LIDLAELSLAGKLINGKFGLKTKFDYREPPKKIEREDLATRHGNLVIKQTTPMAVVVKDP